MNLRTVVFGVTAFALVLTGCSQRMIDFTIISSKNVSIDTSARGSMSEGSDWAHWFLFIPVSGTVIPSLEEAVDRAIEAGGPEYDALMDGVVYSKFYWALIVFGNGFRVRGIPVNTKRLLSQNPDILDRLIVHSSIRDQYMEVSQRNLKKLALSLSNSSHSQ
jgi:hypothetical protein